MGKMPNARVCLRPQNATILSVGAPVLIGAAIRAVHRGAGRAELTAFRMRLLSLTNSDPAAHLVADWLDVKLALMDRKVDRQRLSDRRRVVDRSADGEV